MRILAYLLLLGWTSNPISISAQMNPLKGEIYADFLNQTVPSYDSIFEKESQVVVLSAIKDYALAKNLDLATLSDYLSGDTEENDVFQVWKDKFGQNPISYFYGVPWGNFGDLLARDSTFGYLMLELASLLEQPYEFLEVDSSQSNYLLKYTNGRIPRKAYAWDKFYKKNEGCVGIFKLSDVLVSKNRKYALLIAESYHRPFLAGGNLVFMEKRDEGWRILQYITLWVS
ncbi:MAG: hypothetical protein AAF694_05360 [Bacteroidota bacterium]